MTELHSDHLRIDSTAMGQLIIEPEYLGFLRSNGYNIEGINKVHTVESNSRDTAHMVLSFNSYEYPVDHPELDFEAHKTTLWACSCEDFRYNKSVDVSKDGIKPTEAKACRHIKECSKVERAKEDENQSTLAF